MTSKNIEVNGCKRAKSKSSKEIVLKITMSMTQVKIQKLQLCQIAEFFCFGLSESQSDKNFEDRGALETSKSAGWSESP